MKIDIVGILKDRFIMGIAIWAIALVLFFYFAIQNGSWAKIDELRADIKKQEKDLDTIIRTGTNNPTQAKIEACIKYKKSLEDEIQKCYNFYLETDKPFEKWFPNVDMGTAGIPIEGSFMTVYSKAKRETIVNQLNEHNIKVMDDHDNIVDLDEKKFIVLDLDDPTHQSQFRRVQKKFWIVKKLIDAAVSVEVAKCGPIKIQNPAPPIIIPEVSEPAAGVMYPFEIKVYLPLKNAAKLLSNISDTSKGGPYLYITMVRITRFTKQGEEATERTEPDMNRGRLVPPSDAPEVKITINGNVLDFAEKIEK